MKSRTIVLVVTILVFVVAVAYGQLKNQTKQTTLPSDGRVGKYLISQGPRGAFKFNTETGETWIYTESKAYGMIERRFWEPIKGGYE